MDASCEQKICQGTGENSVLDHSLVSSLLRPANPLLGSEESKHLWGVDCSKTFNVLFLRIWDGLSGSQLDADNCMMARALRQRLDTAKSRTDSLTTHINHGNWTPTPFISFTTSATVAEGLADWRLTRHRGAQHLTAIDPNVRVQAGLPILDLSAEFSHYKIANPYGTWNQYCEDHYLCL